MSQFTFIEEDKLNEYELLEQELKRYKEAYSELNSLVDKLKDAFLGTNWYITDLVNTRQGNEIIINEVIDRFAPKRKEESLLRKWINERCGRYGRN